MEPSNWKRQLAPWLQVLRDAELSADIQPLPTADDLSCLWFTISPPDLSTNPNVWTVLFEAVELMELLARVDQHAAWLLLFELIVQPQLAQRYTALLLSGERTESIGALPRFQIRLYQVHFDAENGTSDRLIELAFQPRDHTPQYEAAKQSLLQQWSQSHGGQGCDREVDGRVRLSIYCILEPEFEDEQEMEIIADEINHAMFDVWELDLDGVRAMRSVLCDDPVKAIFQFHNAADQETQDESVGAPVTPTMGVTINPNASIGLGYHSLNCSEVENSDGVDQEAFYRVLRDNADEDFVEIIIPHHGVCWIERKMIAATCAFPPRVTHPVRHLTLRYVRHESLDATIELLELVGRPIEHVTIMDIPDRVDNKLFEALFTHCPNLVRLDLLSCEVESMEWLWTQPRARMKLQALALSEVFARDRSSWQYVFEALSDSAHPLAQSLERLQFNFFAGTGPRAKTKTKQQDEVLRHAGLMLKKNVRLQHCLWFQCVDTVANKYQPLLLVHDDEPIAVEQAPLAPANTLAFCRSFHHRSLQNHRSKSSWETQSMPHSTF